MNEFIRKGNKYYRNNSDGTQTQVTPTKEGYFTWIQPDGKRVRSQKKYKITPIQPKKEESFWNKLGKGFVNATIGASVAEAPAVQTANGWYMDDNGDWKQDPERPGSKQLRPALAAIGAAGAAATMGPAIVSAAYSVPEIAGALNLYGAYEGLTNLAGDNGIKKTYNKFQQGDYLGGVKSAAGDVFDLAGIYGTSKAIVNPILRGELKYVPFYLNTNKVINPRERQLARRWSQEKDSELLGESIIDTPLGGESYFRAESQLYPRQYGGKGFLDYSDSENYFMSYGLPWIEHQHSPLIYEFPRRTFGTLEATTSKGIVRPGTLVTKQGREALREASYRRTGPVRDPGYESLMGEQRIGNVDRPLINSNKYGSVYDTDPEYLRLHQGNQTVIPGSKMKDALMNSEYKIWQQDPITGSWWYQIHVPK